MHNNEKKAIVNLIISAGILVILIDIFSSNDFGSGLVIAVTLFIVAGVVSTFLGINELDQPQPLYWVQRTLDVNQRRGIVYLVVGAGVIVLMIDLFSSAGNFEQALVLATACFLFAWVLATYLGISKKSQYQASRSQGYNTRNTSRIRSDQSHIQHFSPVPVDQDVKPEKPYFGEPSLKARATARNYCPNCGAEQQSDDDKYCYSCGSEVA